MTVLLLPLIILALVVLLVALAISLTPSVFVAPGVNRGTRFFLVALRLAIGWHFLFEGIEKWTNPAWSSEAYLREASGPLAPLYHDLAGDPLKDRLTVGQGDDFPELLGAEWDAYFERFVSRYDLSDRQRDQAETKFRQARDRTVRFLTLETRPVKVPAKMPPDLEVNLTVPQRLRLYEEKLAEARRLEQSEVPLYGAAGWARVRDVKGEARSIRAGLEKDLADQNKAMMDSLAEVLHGDQLTQEKPAPVGRLSLGSFRAWSALDGADFLVKVGLVAVGGLLILGLLTRTACVAGALFLLSFFLAMPPLPGLPDNPKAEGHYLYVNKNIIEMLACLALATTASGRWAGLDGLLSLLRPSWWRGSRPAEGRHVVLTSGRMAELAPRAAGERGGPPSGKSSEEITHGP